MPMSKDREEAGVAAGRDDSTKRARQEWQRPEIRKLGADEAQASINSNTDGVIES